MVVPIGTKYQFRPDGDFKLAVVSNPGALTTPLWRAPFTRGSTNHAGKDSAGSGLERLVSCARGRGFFAGVKLIALIAATLRWMVVLGALSGSATVTAASLDFPATDFKLLSADRSVVIGRAHFEMAARSSGRTLLQGKYQYTNGEYDIDENWFELGPDAQLPTLLSYRHAFFHADGSLDRLNEADLKSGQASCSIYVNGEAKTLNAKLTFPADTYAGPAVTLPIRNFIRRGSTEGAEFRDFSCSPGPKIYLVNASIERPAQWTLYPGELVQVDIKPDFGLLDILVAPFLPKIRLWFDPAEDFELVGAESSRYYRGLHFIMVRELAVRRR
jgi:hypothetical protein